MPVFNIECSVGKCSPVEVMGTVAAETYKGHPHYGMACLACTLQVALELEAKVQFNDVPVAGSFPLNEDIIATLCIVDAGGVPQPKNSITTVQVSLGGTAVGTINGGSLPVVVTFKNGWAQVTVRATTAGTIELSLGAPTHPYNTLVVTDTKSMEFS